MYIQNRRNGSKFNGCSPLQNCNGLIRLKHAIAYYAFTQRYGQFMRIALAAPIVGRQLKLYIYRGL